MSIDIGAFKEGQRNVWSAGDYPDIAQMIEPVAHVLLERVGLRRGEELLDVATGSGNVAIPAAQLGAHVTGLDLTPKLLAAARARATQAGIEVRWIEGDAEELPFADGSFDRVTSCFGVIFAPRHDVAAAELVRVGRPGATVAFTAWTPEGLNGRLFKTIGAHMPPPPPQLQSPVLWGDEEHVRSLFADTGAEVAFERRTITFTRESPDAWVAYNERVLGPLIMAKAALDPQGRWAELRTDLLSFYSDANEASDGSFSAAAEYLLSVVRRPA
jgi:ubiquinone/menaquinone biosynthesis C-methylase UbiE